MEEYEFEITCPRCCGYNCIIQHSVEYTGGSIIRAGYDIVCQDCGAKGHAQK